MKIHQTEIEVVRGSVLAQPVDAIVNSANTAMRGGGTLNAAIHRAAGRKMLAELEEVAPHGARTSEVVVTGGYKLPHKFVFHVAGPVWSEERHVGCDMDLSLAYRNCLREAHKRGLESMAFPSIATGVYSFPLYRAALFAIWSAADFAREKPNTSLRHIIFAMHGAAEHYHFSEALKKTCQLLLKTP